SFQAGWLTLLTFTFMIVCCLFYFQKTAQNYYFFCICASFFEKNAVDYKICTLNLSFIERRVSANSQKSSPKTALCHKEMF
ncbi:MAG: hypothetical protein J6T80_04285, partial [Paludibacteraceae bacterium]|nr:hypothetical protein [Paludibacteraceae bacterium]